MTDNNKPIANSSVVFREEFDDWALLFDVDTGKGFGINPVSAFIWGCLDGQHSVKDIVLELRKEYDDLPEDVEDHTREFIQALLDNGLAGFEHK